MEKLVYKTLIDCTDEELFNFHLDSNNITKITPPNTKVELLRNELLTYEGKVVKLKTTKFFISTHWEVEIEKIQKPNILIDTALKSPFKYWRHQHIFTQVNDKCELTDVIEYKMPFGVFGKLLNSFIKYDIDKMFNYRHQMTKKILENK